MGMSDLVCYPVLWPHLYVPLWGAGSAASSYLPPLYSFCTEEGGLQQSPCMLHQLYTVSSSNRLLGYLCMYVNKTGGRISFVFSFPKYKTIFRSLYVSLNVLHPGRGQTLAAALLDATFRGSSDTLWPGREAGNALRCVQAHTDCPVCRGPDALSNVQVSTLSTTKRRHGLRPLSVVAPVHSYHLNV